MEIDMDALTSGSLEKATYRILIYGEPKSGKTMALASLPGKVLILDLDGSSIVLRNHPRYKSGEILVAQIGQDFKKLQAVLGAVAKDCGVDFICIDNLTVLSKMFLKEAKANKGKHATQPEYGMAGIRMEDFVENVYTAFENKAHVVFLAWEKVIEKVQMDGSKISKNHPKIYGHVHVEGRSSIIARSEKIKNKYLLRIGETADTMAGDQIFLRDGTIEAKDLIPTPKKETK